MVAYEQISHSLKHAPYQERNPMILVIGSQEYFYALQPWSVFYEAYVCCS